MATEKNSDKLLKATAKAFEEMRSLDGDFLRDNDVSADDCFAWCNQMAAIINGYLGAPKDIQLTILAAGVMDRPELATLIWLNGIRDFAMKKAIKALEGEK